MTTSQSQRKIGKNLTMKCSCILLLPKLIQKVVLNMPRKFNIYREPLKFINSAKIQQITGAEINQEVKQINK